MVKKWSGKNQRPVVKRGKRRYPILDMMDVIHDLAAFPTRMRGGLLSIGKFDGVHSGHAEILRTLRAQADALGVPATVFTFDPAPAEILRPHLAPPTLCTTARKIELIAPFRPDLLLIFPTDRALLSLSAEEFFQKIVLDSLGAVGLVEGGNFNFGRNRDGDRGALCSLCARYDLQLDVVPSIRSLGREISSSRIRSLLREGEVAAAAGMLGHPYRLTGFVAHGEHRGRRLGYPTANLAGVRTLVPKPGLYAARTVTDFGTYRAAVNLGGNPTFGVSAQKIEVHLLDFQGDLYNRIIHVDFLRRLRDVIPFDSKEALLEQMQKDLEQIRHPKSGPRDGPADSSMKG